MNATKNKKPFSVVDQPAIPYSDFKALRDEQERLQREMPKENGRERQSYEIRIDRIERMYRSNPTLQDVVLGYQAAGFTNQDAKDKALSWLESGEARTFDEITAPDCLLPIQNHNDAASMLREAAEGKRLLFMKLGPYVARSNANQIVNRLAGGIERLSPEAAECLNLNNSMDAQITCFQRYDGSILKLDTPQTIRRENVFYDIRSNMDKESLEMADEILERLNNSGNPIDWAHWLSLPKWTANEAASLLLLSNPDIEHHNSELTKLERETLRAHEAATPSEWVKWAANNSKIIYSPLLPLLDANDATTLEKPHTEAQKRDAELIEILRERMKEQHDRGDEYSRLGIIKGMEAARELRPLGYKGKTPELRIDRARKASDPANVKKLGLAPLPD